MLTKIDATQDDINEGTCKLPGQCMLASAINRKLKPGVDCRVYPTNCKCEECFPYVAFWSETAVKYTNLPAKANDMALAFDRGKENAQPISFDLDIPEEFLK